MSEICKNCVNCDECDHDSDRREECLSKDAWFYEEECED